MSNKPIHEVIAEISAKVPADEWAKLGKTHYADPDTIATLSRLERENADLRARLEAAERKLIATGIWREAPCCICGYNGPGYFQPSKHKCAAIDAAIREAKGEA